MDGDKKVFQYVQFKSMINPDFWYKLAEVKLDIEKLNESKRSIYGSYTNFTAVNCFLELDCSGFNSEFKPSKNRFHCHGALLIKNTIEAFKECDKPLILKEEGECFYDDITYGRCLDDPSLLARFILLSFGDLKTYNFYYWFAFPASIEPILYENSPPEKLSNVWSTEQIQELSDRYNAVDDQRLVSFFIVNCELEIKFLKDVLQHNTIESNLKGYDLKTTYFCFSDPSEYENPGWPLRNFLLMLLKLCPVIIGQQIKVLSMRRDGQLSLRPSVLFKVDLNEATLERSEIKWTGWERNSQGKLLPKLSAMGDTMDPIKLSEHFSKLNLKLMKWRLLPNLDLDLIKQQKCLLLGAGTLGCAMARNLLAWGVTDISLVDFGNVAYSNPVRQCLFTHDDAVNNRHKATAAAERLKEILPSVNASGYVLLIPMPGHPISESMKQQTREHLDQINELIKSHDVIFLLTDSRESRWLPTLLGAFYGKIVITTALGFDSYLVMRHGARSMDNGDDEFEDIPGLKCISGQQLGCYFCNDVTAPGNSVKDRTLDQQCTVTRPGVSNLASALATELLVSLIQHKKKHAAPAYYHMTKNNEASIPEGILGILPHSIRGYLSNFQHILPATERFTQCVACSEYVLQQYEDHGTDFLMRVFDSAEYLEKVTGIDKMSQLDNEIIDCDEFDSD